MGIGVLQFIGVNGMSADDSLSEARKGAEIFFDPHTSQEERLWWAQRALFHFQEIDTHLSAGGTHPTDWKE